MTEKERDKRTKFNLENYVRMAFHPKGIRRFAEGVVSELDIEGSYTAKLLISSSTMLDVAKYCSLGAGVYLLFRAF